MRYQKNRKQLKHERLKHKYNCHYINYDRVKFQLIIKDCKQDKNKVQIYWVMRATTKIYYTQAKSAKMGKKCIL